VRVPQVDWSLEVQYRAKTFTGKVTLHLEDVDPPLIVDSADLIIETSHLDGQPVSLVEDPSAGVLRVNGVSPGRHDLVLSYHGKVDESALVGLYSSPAGPGYALTAMFFPTGCRRLVPCFESPSIKSVYALTLTVDTDVQVIFNTEPIRENVQGTRRRIEFSPTPPMATYLLYLGLGPFEMLERGPTSRRVIVATSPGRSAEGEFAVVQAPKILGAYEAYYGQPYPLQKLHLIGVENFWAGAQENWGAIVFRESILLVGPTTSEQLRRHVLIVLSHEIAHQWFGNLVTPARWDDFWLNESFADFAAFKIVDRVFPELESWNDFLWLATSSAYWADCLRATHPIQVPVHDGSELGEIADDITYGKGASVLRMIESYLGEEAFRGGVREYLQKFRYANARAADLWECLETAAQVPVVSIMKSWITQPGHPLVEVSATDQGLHLRQRRYLADGSQEPGIWPIPLRIRSKGSVHQTLFAEPSIDLPVPASDDLCVNPGRFGFYRVAYQGSLLDQVWSAFPRWDPIDQWGLMEDVASLVLSGDLPLERFLEAVDRSRGLESYLPLRELLDSTHFFRNVLGDFPPLVERMQRFVEHQLSRIGLANDEKAPATNSILRERFALNLARLDSDFARQMANRYSEWDSSPADLRLAIAVGFGRTGGKPAFEAMLERLRTTHRDDERIQMILGITASPDPSLAQQALTLFPGPGVTPSLCWNVWSGMGQNLDVAAFRWPWLRDQLPRLAKLWDGTPILSRFLSTDFPIYALGREAEAQEYFARHSFRGTERGVRVGLELLSIYSRFRARVDEAHPRRSAETR
jgi:tricorn protease interacting factor F2/3